MDNEEAARLLEEALATFREEPYEYLVRRIGADPVCMTRVGATTLPYQLEFTVLWECRPGSDVRVPGAIDDGRWRAFAPLTRAFIKAADGSFVGEVTS